MKKTTTATTKEAKTTTKRTRKANTATVSNPTTNKEDKDMKKTTTTTQGNKTQKGNKKNTPKNTTTNKGKVTNNKTQTAAERQKAAQEEEYNKLKEQAQTTKTTAKETRKEIHETFTAAKGEVKEIKSFLYYCHALNRMATGKDTVKNVNPANLFKAYQMTSTATPTANNYEGFSYDVVKVDKSGHVCRLVSYNPENGDETTTAPNGATLVTTKRYQAVEMYEHYTGTYLMVPVTINENGVLSAVESYLQMYAAAVPDLLAFGKRYEQAKQKRDAEKAAAKREKEIRQALKEAKERAEKATQEAEEAQKKAEEDTHRANMIALAAPTPKKSFWQRISAAMF